MSSTGHSQPQITVQLRAVSVHTHHGVTEAEREIGQRMEFDIDLRLASCPASKTDRLDGTVDYGEVTEMLVELATERSYLTLERLCDVIAGRLLDRFDTSEVRVRATKPEPPIPVVMDGASVELVLRRDDKA